MMRLTGQAVVAAVFVGLFGVQVWGDEPKGAEAKKEAIKQELKRMEGTWKVTSIETRGEKLSDDDLKDLRLSIKGGRWTLTHARGIDKAMIKIDPAKAPKTMDLTFTALGTMGQSFKVPSGRKIVSRAIYKFDYVEGEGETLTICRVSQPRLPRPKEFKTTPNSNSLFVFKRENK